MPQTNRLKVDYPAVLLDYLYPLIPAGTEILREYKFHPVRRWKFDIAIPALMLAIEVEGGVWVKGRHITPTGFLGDCEKYAEAAIAGWIVLRIPSDWIIDGTAILMLQRMVAAIQASKAK